MGVDFALFSSAVYAADKKVARRRTDDRWTRDLQMSVPVTAQDLWTTATPEFKEALEFLTGDRWVLEWRPEQNRIWGVRNAARHAFDAVCLFSGGLDSLVGAIDLLESPSQPSVVLLSHYDSTLTPRVQEELAGILSAHYGPRRVKLVQVMVRPTESRELQQYPLSRVRETTTRSRSFVFLGLGLAAASALGPATPLYIPENGFIALNIPLVSARLGSCSTRTTHPYFLGRLMNALDRVGLKNPILNPYGHLTKGEVLAGCKNQDLLRRLAPKSISCAHPEVGRYEHTGYGNCGYCYPCLIRRASMHTVGLDRSTEYNRDVRTDSEIFSARRARGRDARAVFGALQLAVTPMRSSDLAPALAGPVPRSELSAYARLYREGLRELRSFFEEGSSPGVRQVAGF